MLDETQSPIFSPSEYTTTVGDYIGMVDASKLSVKLYFYM